MSQTFERFIAAFYKGEAVKGKLPGSSLWLGLAIALFLGSCLDENGECTGEPMSCEAISGSCEDQEGCSTVNQCAGAVADLGDPNEIGRVLSEFQRYLYERDRVA
jgi:hypothetical protein